MSSLWAQFWAARNPPAEPKHISYLNKTVLVTGANSGLGHEAAVKYAALGENPLILAVRTQENGEQAKEDIISRTSCSPDIFIIETVDFSTFAFVRAFSDRIVSHPLATQLHVTQLDAGVAQWQYEKSPDGYEVTLEVNVLSQALLALLLLPKMSATAAASVPSDDSFVRHLSFLHSIAGFEVTADWLSPGQSPIQRYNDQSKWDPTKQYYLAKLALWNVIEGLIDRCSKDEESRKVIINASCPSGCKTNMGRNFPKFVKPILADSTSSVAVQLSKEPALWSGLPRWAQRVTASFGGMTSFTSEDPVQTSFPLIVLPYLDVTDDSTCFLRPSEFMASQRGREVSQETWHEVLEILRQRHLIPNAAWDSTVS
ncbi:Short-chain dehydrogenase TIC 32, chloroplastic [Cytospora mali]|uniref:Short-chain dehydrogenase TIC 32, chloroplastic n=1 Tax=Cytospora mali TaxID=578113 RepID=A0A194V3E0_CYTMA|nr:Short-chain dehydrogenase TIC 32, chloroplastic [Valsa mali var. pyri (nom. inval.)]